MQAWEHEGRGKCEGKEGQAENRCISVVEGRSVGMKVKNRQRSSIILPTLSYASETWKWNMA